MGVHRASTEKTPKRDIIILIDGLVCANTPPMTTWSLLAVFGNQSLWDWTDSSGAEKSCQGLVAVPQVIEHLKEVV
jgi:hypothetical protein